MIKLAVVAALAIHGVIHGIGFAKAFGLGGLDLSQPITRGWGVAWGAVALVMIAAAIARIGDASWWWMLAAPAVVASQIAIIAAWTDAWAGTVVNVALAVPVLLAFGSWRFAARTDSEVARFAARAPAPGAVADIVERADLAPLPPVVAVWLERAGVVGRARTTTVWLTQRGELQSAPGKDWLPFRAEQWVLVREPAFLWIAHVDGKLWLDLAGRDRYLDGKGSMRIELLSLIPVVDAAGPKIDQGALVRYLAEMMWYPSAVLEPYVRWEAIDDRSARAVMRYGDVEAAGVFRFDDDGDIIGFEARRYRNDSLEDWIIEIDPASYRELDGVRIPARSTVAWRDDAGESWSWLRVEVDSLHSQ